MDYVALGQVITDDVVFPDNKPREGQLGGIAYTLAGMRLWSDSVGVCGGIGEDFDALHGEWFRVNRIDTRGLSVKARLGPHSRVRYFEDGEREEVSLPGCAELSQMMPEPEEIPEAYRACKGIYFFKDLDDGYWDRMARYLRGNPAVSIWEILGKSARAENFERVCSLARETTIFSLNRTEAGRLCGGADPLDAVKTLLDAGVGTVLLRMSEQGALAGDRRGIWHIPAAPADIVDVTGGGNSSTGGFLVGYCESGGDVAEAGKCAAAAAALILEQYGPPRRIDEVLWRAARQRAGQIVAEKII